MAAGLAANEIRRLTRSPDWERVGRDVFRRTGSAPTHLQTAITAVLLTGSNAALYGRSAAWLWLYENTAPLRPIHVVRRRGHAMSQAGAVRLHRFDGLPDWWVVSHRGVPVCRPALVAVQIFASSRYESAERQVDRLWSNRLLSGRSIKRCLAELGARGRNGIGGLRRYLDERGEAWTPPASALESRVIQILRSAGIEVRVQVDLGSDEEWTGRVDLVCVGTNVVIEVQSELHHASLSDRRADAERIAKLEAAGFVVVEITDTEAFHAPGVVVRRVQEALSGTPPRPTPPHPTPPHPF